jgi:hypothetical protein
VDTVPPADATHGQRPPEAVAFAPAYERDSRVRWHPAVDWTRVITTAEVMAGGVLIARHLASRPSAAKARVTMGPGGWVSMKGGVMAVRPAERGWRRRRAYAPAAAPRTRRPWWARLLAATTLESLIG